MAIKITEECINCGACEPECPNNAIYEGGVEWSIADGTSVKGGYTLMDGSVVDASQRNEPVSVDTYYIVPNKCTECQGFHEEPQCASVCPVDVCIPDELYRETVDELLAKKKSSISDSGNRKTYQQNMKRVIAFVTGGYSGEAEVSYKSAVTIEAHVDQSRYEVYRIDITPEAWFHKTQDGRRISVDKNDFSLQLGNRKILFDAVLIGIHGTPGEDGKLQGYFDLMNLPYSSCDAACSALTFNKRYTVAVAAFAGILVSKSQHLFKLDKPLAAEVLQQLTLPVFVKPNNGGSSIGMSKVNKPEEMGPALEKAFREDEQVLVEEFIEGREFTIGVFRHQGEIIAMPFTEVSTSKDFFDFEAKYSPGFSREVTPAEVDESIAEKVRQTAKKIYTVFHCSGVIRIDMIYNEERGAPYLLEINTVPGQTEASIVPQQVRAMGWTLNQFYSALIEDALSRSRRH